MAMDADYREKIKRRVVRRGWQLNGAVIEEPDLTEGMDTITQKIAEHKSWMWLQVGPFALGIESSADEKEIPEYLDTFSDIVLASGGPLERVDQAEFARRKAEHTGGASTDFDCYLIADNKFKFIHANGNEQTVMSLGGTLPPSQLDDKTTGWPVFNGVRNSMPENFDKCLEYGTLAEVLPPEQAKTWLDRFNGELERLALLDDKAPVKVVRGSDGK